MPWTAAEDELKELGDTLDDLFARLEAAFEAQRRFVANASHELRTPLARERALVQVALGDPSTPDVWRATGQELLASNREQETLIEALLTLASSESGLDHREPVDLAVIAETVVRDRPEADGSGLEVELALEPRRSLETPGSSSDWSRTWSTTPSAHNVRVVASGCRPEARTATLCWK